MKKRQLGNEIAVLARMVSAARIEFDYWVELRSQTRLLQSVSEDKKYVNARIAVTKSCDSLSTRHVET
jgi:hypothetical protein